MPLARIISRRVDDAQSLVQELHAQGYEVEVFSPDEPMHGDADLELFVETAPVADAATFVENRANEGTDVFVAPGVIAPAVDEKALAATAAARAAEEAAIQAERERARQERMAAEVVERRRVAEEVERRQAEEAERQRALVEQRRQAEEAEKERLRLAAEKAEQERVAAEQKRAAEEAERQRVAMEVAAKERERAEAERRRLAVEAEQRRVAAEAEQQRIAAENEARRAALAAQRVREEQERAVREEKERREREERMRVAREAEEERKRHAAEVQRRAVAAAQEEQNRSAFRRVEEAALLRAQAMELERRRADEAHGEEERLETKRVAAERQRLEAEERERAVATARTKAEEEARLKSEQEARARAEAIAREERLAREREMVAAQAPRPTVPMPSGDIAYAAAMKYATDAEPGYRGIRFTRQHRYGIATGAAAVIAVALALGWVAVANRRPANPLGTGALMQQQNVDQQSPFGSTTMKAVAPTPVSQPSIPQSATVSHQQKPATTKAVTKRPASVPVKHARRAADNDVADDVVVRHFENGKPVTSKSTAVKAAQTVQPPQQKQQAGLKKISDMQ